MTRPLLISAALIVTAAAALAADSKVDSVATFKTVENDAGKLKIFYEMTAAMDKAGDNPDAATDAKIDGYMKELGPDFATAWNAGEGLDEKSQWTSLARSVGR